MTILSDLTFIAEKIMRHRDEIETEEATKNAFILPFISKILGYDIFDPSEVIPEFTADVGIKKGEKVDYAIQRDGKVQILIECKKNSAKLEDKDISQLFRYFATTKVRIAILTNGSEYRFYTDIDNMNTMDEKPFMVLDLLNLDTKMISTLEKLSKEKFDINDVIESAEKLKYLNTIKEQLQQEFFSPSESFVKEIVSRFYEGRFTQGVLDKFTPLVARAINQFISESVNERLMVARIDPESDSKIVEESVDDTTDDQNDKNKLIATTEEELLGFNIIRAILCSEIDAERISYNDTQQYFAIILDNSSHKTIVRLFFNSKNVKFMRIADDGNPNESERIDLSRIEDIYNYSERLKNSLRNLLNPDQ